MQTLIVLLRTALLQWSQLSDLVRLFWGLQALNWELLPHLNLKMPLRLSLKMPLRLSSKPMSVHSASALALPAPASVQPTFRQMISVAVPSVNVVCFRLDLGTATLGDTYLGLASWH